MSQDRAYPSTVFIPDPSLGLGPKFGSGTQIWVWDPNLGPGPKLGPWMLCEIWDSTFFSLFTLSWLR